MDVSTNADTEILGAALSIVNLAELTRQKSALCLLRRADALEDLGMSTRPRSLYEPI